MTTAIQQFHVYCSSCNSERHFENPAICAIVLRGPGKRAELCHLCEVTILEETISFLVSPGPGVRTELGYAHLQGFLGWEKASCV